MQYKYTLFLLIFLLFGNHGHTEEKKQYVKFNAEHTYQILDPTTKINRKQLLLLKMRKTGLLANEQMYIGADMQVIADIQESNMTAKFAYLMRHPTQTNHGGRSVSEFVIHDAGFHVIGTPTAWATIHFHALFNPQQSFGEGTIIDLERNQISLYRGYILVGDLSRCPLYASIGKMTTPFGLTDTVNPFTVSTVWHTFGGLACAGIVGYQQNGLNLSFTAIQGGAQYRSANSGAVTPDDVDNFTVNASYTIKFTKTVSLHLGGGYLAGSAYCQKFPITHFSTCDGKKNPAWDIHAVFNWAHFLLMGELAKTTDVWPGTHNPHPPLDVFAAHKVIAYDIGAKYRICTDLPSKDVGLSIDYSQLEAGPSGSPWQKQTQFVTGLEIRWDNRIKLFAEYIQTNGYVPLNFISGPDPFDPSETPGTTHSVSDAKSNIFLIGFRAAI